MATNNRPLKAYVRYDGSGRAVSSSLIWRKNKPKVGNWKEVQGYECCDDSGGSCNFNNCREVTYQIEETINFGDGFCISCEQPGSGCMLIPFPTNGFIGIIFQEAKFTAQNNNNITAFVSLLNNTFGWLGSFSVVNETTINVCLLQGAGEQVCNGFGNVTISAYYD